MNIQEVKLFAQANNCKVELVDDGVCILEAANGSRMAVSIEGATFRSLKMAGQSVGMQLPNVPLPEPEEKKPEPVAVKAEVTLAEGGETLAPAPEAPKRKRGRRPKA